MKAITVYGILKKLIMGVASGVKSAVVNDDDKTIKFTFMNNSVATMHFNQPKDGKDGLSVKNIEKTDDKHFRLILSDDTVTDEIEMPANMGGVLEEDLKASTVIGSVKKGMVYAKGTSFETILKDILTSYTKASCVITFSPTTEVYDAVDDELNEIEIIPKITKGTENIKSVKWYVGDVLVHELTTGVENGGTFTYNHIFSTPQKTSFETKIVIEDETDGGTVTTKKTVVFIGKTYYGILDADISTPTEDDIKGLENKVVKNTKTLTYSNIVTPWGRVCMAYPKALDALTSIMDTVNNFNYTTEFEKQELTVDGIPYLAYVQKEPSGADGVLLKFS